MNPAGTPTPDRQIIPVPTAEPHPRIVTVTHLPSPPKSPLPFPARLTALAPWVMIPPQHLTTHVPRTRRFHVKVRALYPLAAAAGLWMPSIGSAQQPAKLPVAAANPNQVLADSV